MLESLFNKVAGLPFFTEHLPWLFLHRSSCYRTTVFTKLLKIVRKDCCFSHVYQMRYIALVDLNMLMEIIVCKKTFFLQLIFNIFYKILGNNLI